MRAIEGRRGVKRKKGTDMPNPDFAEQGGNGQLNEATQAPTDDATYKAVAEYLTNLITENKTLKERLLTTERNNEQLNALCSEHEAKLKAVAEALGKPLAAPNEQ
jgi:hypothetical protein